jgi:signal transduction histidine kinase
LNFFIFDGVLNGVAKFLKKFEENDIESKTRFPFLVLAVSIFLTLGITYNFYRSSLNKDTTRFNNEVNRVQSAIENKINLYTALLKGGRGFVESAAELNRESFANYIQSLDLERNYKSVQAIGYNKIVLPEEREALIKKMQAEGIEDFQMFPGGERDSYQAIIYIEPFNEQNKKDIGYDMFTEPNRREALVRAGDSGMPTASTKVNLLQGSGANSQTGFLIYLPIYKKGKIPETVEERRKNLIGYIYSPFRSADFLDEIQKSTDTSDIAVRIYDGEPKPENLLSQTTFENNPKSVNQIEKDQSTENTMDIAGRKWTIKYDSLPAFSEQSSINWTPLIFLSGIIFSFLLFGMTYWETSARLKLETTAARLTESEAQKQKLLENEQKARLLAEQANTTKDEFIAVVSHELRTPLNAIAGWTKILKTDNLSANTKNLALEKINKNLRSQTKLVEELLEYSQILSGIVNFEEKPVNFSDLFENTFQDVEAAAQERNIEFIKDNQLNGHLILGDEAKIKIVIYNLLTNAVKFTHSGGRIETRLSEADGAVQMTVKDNGKGMSSEFLPQIFDRFSQADTSSTRNYGGLGLGLTISKHIVKLHNGTIEANSEGIGTGSVFTLKFPHQKRIQPA